MTASPSRASGRHSEATAKKQRQSLQRQKRFWKSLPLQAVSRGRSGLLLLGLLTYSAMTQGQWCRLKGNKALTGCVMNIIEEINLQEDGAKFRRCDLHIHSFGGSYEVTDSSMTPQNIIDLAIENKLEIIAITD